MIRELENFTIRSEEELDYFDETVDYIAENEKRILKFFKLDKLPQKVDIQIVNYEQLKEYYASHNWKFHNFIRGVSNLHDKEIRMLTLEDQRKYTTHKDADIDQFKTTTLHEFVHECHGFVCSDDSKEINWFREGLATNLSNQKWKIVDLSKCDFEKVKNDLYNYKPGYSYAHTLVNYVISNYSEEEIFKLSSDGNYLKEKADSMFKEAREWVSKKIKTTDDNRDR